MYSFEMGPVSDSWTLFAWLGACYGMSKDCKTFILTKYSRRFFNDNIILYALREDVFLPQINIFKKLNKLTGQTFSHFLELTTN